MAEHCERKVSNFSRRIRYLFPLNTENLPTFSSASLRIFFTPILKYSDASCMVRLYFSLMGICSILLPPRTCANDKVLSIYKIFQKSFCKSPIKKCPAEQNSTGPDDQPTAPSYASSIATRFSSRVTRSSRVRSSSGSWSSSAIRNFVII